MESECTNVGIGIYFQCRILASKYDDKLKSRESTSEYLGVSVSSLANYERGITVPPMDLVMMMADVYNAPQLKNLYCKQQCPLGKEQQLEIEVKSLEAIAVNIVSKLDLEEINGIKKQLLKISEDGKISLNEEKEFVEISVALEELATTISGLKLLKEKLTSKE